MAFQKKTWKDRITEFPTRRTLTKSDGSTELVTVARAEGTVSQEGDAFNAASMNDLEERISQANNDLSERINSGLSDIDVRYNSETRAPEWSPRGADTWSPFSSSRFEFVSGVTRNSADSIDFVIPEDGNYILVVQVSSAGTLAENYAKVQKLTLNGTTYKYTGAKASQACNASSYYNIMIWYSLFGVKAGKGHIADTSHSLLGGQLFKI